jgi:hypothetical protein
MNLYIKNTFLVAISIILLGSLFAQQTPLVVEGSYQGKNIFVKNPYRNEKVGFCVSKVTVNGNVTTDEINSASFEIDLSLYQFLLGEKVEVKIFHDQACTPKVINPQVLEPKSTFAVQDINVSDDKTLSWTSTQESGKLTYIVEQFKWNGWVKVGEVEGNGNPTVQNYKFKVETHSGENKFRIYQTDYTKKKRVSKEVVYNSNSPKITFYPKKVRKDIVFSGKTTFEIYDTYGNIVKKGAGETLDCSTLKKGFYYLKFDNEVGTFNKK